MSKIKKVESVKVVQKSLYSGRRVLEESEAETVLDVHIFKTPPAMMEVDVSRTLNLGDYNSARLRIAFTVPMYKEAVDTPEKFANVFKGIYNLVGSAVSEELENISGGSLSESSLEDELLGD